MMDTATNAPNADPSAGEVSKAAQEAVTALSKMYSACHKSGASDLCDQITGMMAAVSDIETAHAGGGMGSEPLPADQAALDGGGLPPEGALPSPTGGEPMIPPGDGPAPLPPQDAGNLDEAIGMLHNATQDDKRRRGAQGGF